MGAPPLATGQSCNLGGQDGRLDGLGKASLDFRQHLTHPLVDAARVRQCQGGNPSAAIRFEGGDLRDERVRIAMGNALSLTSTSGRQLRAPLAHPQLTRRAGPRPLGFRAQHPGSRGNPDRDRRARRAARSTAGTSQSGTPAQALRPLRPRSSLCMGRRIVNTAPRPRGSFSACTSPPCRSIRCRTRKVPCRGRRSPAWATGRPATIDRRFAEEVRIDPWPVSRTVTLA